MSTHGYKFVFCDAVPKSVALIQVEIPDNAHIIVPVNNEKFYTKRRCNEYIFTDIIGLYQFSLAAYDNAKENFTLQSLYPFNSLHLRFV